MIELELDTCHVFKTETIPVSSRCPGIFMNLSYHDFLYKPRDTTNKSDFKIERPELIREVCGYRCSWSVGKVHRLQLQMLMVYKGLS